MPTPQTGGRRGNHRYGEAYPQRRYSHHGTSRTDAPSINKYGTYTVRAKDDAEAEKLVRDAHLLEEAGCFGLVLEKIPAALAARVASELTIPVIGIGAGGDVDGQVLVVQDMLGMNNGFRPRFLRRYADLHTVMTDAISRYVSDVKNLDFPNEKEQY